MSANPTQPAENINLGRLKSLGVTSPEFVPFLLPRKYLDLRHEQLVSQFMDLPVGVKRILYGILGGYEVKRNSIPNRLVITLVDYSERTISFGAARLAASHLGKKTPFLSIDFFCSAFILSAGLGMIIKS